MMSCIFCRIVAKEVLAHIVYEDEKTLGFLDHLPIQRGHTLVILKAHHESLLDIPVEGLKDLILTTQRVGAGILKAMGAEGFNLVMNNGRSAGQEVPHAHFHILPRFRGDGLRIGFPRNRYPEEEMRRIQEAIKKELA
jgi:histidine triad (HIT) family protein